MLITLPLLLLVVVFAVMNRQVVEVDFWPLPFHPRIPLSAIAFMAFFLGAVSGGLAVWLGGVRKRRRERRRVAEEQAVGLAEPAAPKAGAYNAYHSDLTGL